MDIVCNSHHGRPWSRIFSIFESWFFLATHAMVCHLVAVIDYVATFNVAQNLRLRTLIWHKPSKEVCYDSPGLLQYPYG